MKSEHECRFEQDTGKTFFIGTMLGLVIAIPFWLAVAYLVNRI